MFTLYACEYDMFPIDKAEFEITLALMKFGSTI